MKNERRPRREAGAIIVSGEGQYSKRYDANYIKNVIPFPVRTHMYPVARVTANGFLKTCIQCGTTFELAWQAGGVRGDRAEMCWACFLGVQL